MGRDGEGRPGVLCPPLSWLELRNNSCSKLRWEVGLGNGGGSALRAWRGQALCLGVTVPSLGVTVPPLGKQVRHLMSLPCLGLSTRLSLGMAKGLHVDVLANKTCGFEGQHTSCAARPLPWERFYSYSSTGIKHKCSGFRRIFYSHNDICIFREHCSRMEFIKMNLQVTALFNFLTNSSNSMLNSKGARKWKYSPIPQ